MGAVLAAQISPGFSRCPGGPVHHWHKLWGSSPGVPPIIEKLPNISQFLKHFPPKMWVCPTHIFDSLPQWQISIYIETALRWHETWIVCFSAKKHTVTIRALYLTRF